MEHRLVPCPKCEVTTRLKVTEKNYGHTLEITCPKCGEKFKTMIFDDNKINGLIEDFISAIQNAIDENKVVLEAKQALRDAGFLPMMLFSGGLIPVPRQPVEQRVENGEVKDGTFDEADEKWAKEFKINLKA